MSNAPSREIHVDYRTLLAECLRRMKAVDPKFSHRFVSRKMGGRSAGWFADVLAGRQKLRLRHVAPLAALFRMPPRERELFKVLVEMAGANGSEEATAAYGKWLELKGVTQEALEKDRFKYFDRWYYPVLREVLLCRPFDGDYSALGARLDPPITARQAREAVKILMRLGLANPGASAPVLVKRPGRTSQWKAYIRAFSELAMPALEKLDKDQRDFSSLVLSLSPESLVLASEEIAAMRRRLLALSERDRKKNRVYQCLIQVFPLTQPLEDSHA